MFHEAIKNMHAAKRMMAGCYGFVLLLVLAGCSSAPVKKETVFFPVAPDEPRIQFLVGINGSDDFEEKKSAFSLFLTGRQNLENSRIIYKPYGVVVHKGKIWVCDLGGRLVVIDPEKQTLSLKHDKKKVLNKPINIAFDEDDNYYVADTGAAEVLVFNSKDELIRKIGKDDKMKPADVATDKDYLYVLDMTGNQIRIYDLKTSQYVKSIGKNGDAATDLALPSNFTIDEKGVIYVTNIAANKVIKMDKDGHFLGSFGQMGDSFGEFARPKGIALDAEGRIFVVDAAMQSVQIFNPTADRLLIPFGNPGLVQGSLNLPAGIAVVAKDTLPFFKKYLDPSFEAEYFIFVTNQYGTSKLSVYALGHRKGANLESYKEQPKPAEKQGDKPGEKPGDKPEPAK